MIVYIGKKTEVSKLQKKCLLILRFPVYTKS